MQRAGSSNASTTARNDSQRPVSRFSSVTSATPAKRITFFKSGDTQFSGVRMAIHRRSFKCFEALLDDLSQKVPLPFGVRTITTPRGTHSIQRLEQLEDGGFYLCSDRRYVKPVDLEAAGKRPAAWHHSHPHNTRKKPSRPEEPPTGHSGQHFHRHPKRILLVKNNDPAVRRSIILSRRTARSLRVFLDEISELMQCHVRKLYTLEGRKIDSIQSLMECPSVLVCVGREPFKPLLLENLRKQSEEKLPGMGARSRSSLGSEGHESKKNVNFGLETKKSIIHPRSDSSNRSTRFSLSSEKSYPNGICVTPGQPGSVSTCPYTKDVILNDDIEKRVLVNKDGSLSVEMKVRFRLVNDETLRWSTEIKKSATTSSESSVKEEGAHCLPGRAEYSDPESNSACEAEGICATKRHQKYFEESHCQNCCNHCQEYDIWKNPMHKDSRDNGVRKSLSSSGSSHKIVHKKASVDSVRTISRSSEEYTEHVVKKASCFQQTVEDGDTTVEYCSISRCCSRSEIPSTAAKLKGKRPNEDMCETNIVNLCYHNGENILCDPGMESSKVTEDRPISAVSNSSKVLESLKEDQDDDYDDLPPSASRASEWSQSDNLEHEQIAWVHCCGSQASPNLLLSPRPPSEVSSCSAYSPKRKKYRSMYPAHPAPDSARSSASKLSSKTPSCHCGIATPGSAASDMLISSEERVPTTASKESVASTKSRARTNSPRATGSDVHGALEEVYQDRTENEGRPRTAMSADTGVSGKSRNSSVCPYCGGCERSIAAASGKSEDTNKDAEVRSVGGRSCKSQRSEASAKSERANQSTKETPVLDAPNTSEPVPSKVDETGVMQGRSESALSGLTNHSATSKQSNKSNRTACGRSFIAHSPASENALVGEREERTKSAMSVKSNTSAKSKTNSVILEVLPASGVDSLKDEENSQDERAVSPVSSISNKSRSSRSRTSHKSHCSHSEKASIPEPDKLDNLGKTSQDKESERGESPVSSSSACNEEEPETIKERVPVSPVPEIKSDQDSELTSQARAASAMSSFSEASIRSSTPSRTLQENPEPTILNTAENAASNVESDERVPSAISIKTHFSIGSHKSNKSYTTPSIIQSNTTRLDSDNGQENIDLERPTSALSKSSKTSVKSNALQSVLHATGQKDTKDSTQNCLTVSSPSPKKTKRTPTPSTPKSPVTTRPPSGVSVNSRASSTKSPKSSMCHCSSNSNVKEPDSKVGQINDECSQRAASSLSGKSKTAKSPIPSPNDQTEEPLSPTLTGSVSPGLEGEVKSVDLNERSISPTSQIAEESKLERVTHEPDSDRSEQVKTVERTQSATSLSSAVSKNSKKSAVSQDLCKSAKQATSAASVGKPESVLTTKSKGESTTGSRLNDGNHTVLPVHLPCSKSPRNASRPSENNSTIKRNENAQLNNNDEGQTDKASTISGRSSKCSQSKTVSGKSTPVGTVKPKNQVPAKIEKSSSPNLKVKGTKMTSDCNSGACSVKSLKDSKSDNRTVKKPQNCEESANEMPNKNVMPVIHLGSSGDSVLSHTLSAADLLREKVDNARPISRGSGSKNSNLEEAANIGSKCGKRCTAKQRKRSTSSLNKNEDQGLELMPSSLPNASPTEVINDWLNNIPIDGPMYELEDDFNEPRDEAVEEESVQKELGEISENVIQMKESEEESVKEDNSIICNETLNCNETELITPETTAANMDSSSPSKLTKRESLPKRCHSSVQIMKVLLSPRLGRCNSLPEVSPVYGRKLSTSAKGLLDCLANLQLIDSDPKNEDDKYNEIISIFQSLWNCEPSESGQDHHKMKDHRSAEDEFNPRSSSGVDVSSGSIGSGKGSINGTVEKSETAQGTIVPIFEGNLKEDEEHFLLACPPSTDTSHVPSDPLTPDIAERVRCSQEEIKMEEEQQTEGSLHAKEEVIQSGENQKETNETNESSKNSSGNDCNGLKSPADTETDLAENANSEKTKSIQRSTLTRRVSQDPDPVWVLSLLKKLENQFMSHYANAMAEFKVKWDLDDNEMLDRMISELKEEVQKRIQSSINRELQKIQSRAGRTPRPPIDALSRESTVQTEQRRRRLKVMRNKSIDPAISRSEDMNTASGTELSDQRSDDEYCPCDTCMKKKMASRAVQRAEALCLAPVMKEFDLRKILQTKKNSPASMETMSKLEERKCLNVQEQQENNLDILHEESEVNNDEKNQRDEDKEDQGECTAEAAQSEDKNPKDDATLSSKDKDADGELINDGDEDVEGGLSDDENKAEEENSGEQAPEDGKDETEEDRIGEGETETERAEEVNEVVEEVAADNGEDETADNGDATNSEHEGKEETTEEAEEQPKEAEDQTETLEDAEETTDGKDEELDESEVENAGAELSNNEGDGETPNEGDDDDDGNQGASTEEKGEHEEKEVASLRASEEENVENCGTDDHQNDIEAKDTDETENQDSPEDGIGNKTEIKTNSPAEGLTEQVNSDDPNAEASDQEDSGKRLNRQMTKTSVESQPGSLEHATDKTVQAKLKDIHSFMESLGSQDDSIVVITKQSPFTERKVLSSRHGNKDDPVNELIEWQVSPKRRTRSPARANKQRRPKDSDVKVDDLEF